MRCELGILKSVKLEIQNFPKYVKSTNLSHISAKVNFTIHMDLFVTDFSIDCWHSSKFKLKLIKRVELFVVLYGFYKMSSSTINLQLHPPCCLQNQFWVCKFFTVPLLDLPYPGLQQWTQTWVAHIYSLGPQ